MANAGQTCIAVERVYVERPVYDDFVARVSAKALALRVGAPHGPGSVDFGAITLPAQLDTIARHVDGARADGAVVRAGGARLAGPGRFYAPTVLSGADHGMAVMTEETFGPVLPVMPVADAEEAIRLANDSPYGLAASVFSRDAARAEAIARRLEAGVVSVNDAPLHYMALGLPMGGWKASGLGVRHGPDGIRKYTRHQGVVVRPARLMPRRELHQFPYRAPLTRTLAAVLRRLYR